MEIESKNGSKIRLQENTDLGRGLLGFNSTDPTVSRRHISLKLNEEDGTRVYFQVKGKNPIWVHHATNNDDIRVYKTSQRGELNIGDSFCVSSKDPFWFKVAPQQSSNRYDEAFAEINDDDDEIETGDVSDIDPRKEFNFVVMGHEFDCYQITHIRKWNWFLEEPDEEKRSRKKRKKSNYDDDDDDDDAWTGESEEDAELIKKLRNDPKPKYSSTRSKDKQHASCGAKDDGKRKATIDEEEDDEDETLGGFIVDDEDIGEGDDEDDDEEEEFEEDENDE